MKGIADRLGVTASYLSATENGKRIVPHEWITTITTLYELDDISRAELKKSWEDSADSRSVVKKAFEIM